jgi:CheY-specific phosphatase CheX
VVQTVRRDHPELPILRVRSSEDDVAGADEVQVVDRAELLGRAERLLVQRAYPASMLEAVPRAATDTLREAFNTDAELLSVSLKLTRHMLGRVVPVLPLSGPGISGHLVLNVVSPQLRRIHRSSFPSATRVTIRDLGDLGGELLNQTAGRIKGALRATVAIELGLPMVITGENLTLRVASPAPTVLFDFAAFGRHLFLEFALAATDEAAAAPEIGGVEQLAAGELSLF